MVEPVKKKSNTKKILLGSIIGILIGSLLSVSYAFFTYNRTGLNNKLIVGDIYMRYKELSNTINIRDMSPRSDKPSEYFEFTIEGKNTYKEKDIIYDINILYGNSETGKERIGDEFLRFTLAEKLDGESEFTEVIQNASYVGFENALRIWKQKILANTTSDIVNTYRLYVWIDNSVGIGNTTEADYSIERWNNLFASVKVNVTGDFEEKELSKSLYDVVKTGATSDAGRNLYARTGNGKFVRSTTANDPYPIYYYRGEVTDNNAIFANKCWKIVRTTDTGGTKLIYNGEPKVVDHITDSLSGSGYANENASTLNTSITNVFSFDSNDKTWNLSTNDAAGTELSFKVPAGDNYTINITGTTSQRNSFSITIYKDQMPLNGTGGGGGSAISFLYNYGSLTSDNIVKIVVSGGGVQDYPGELKIQLLSNENALNESDYTVLTNGKNLYSFTYDETTKEWSSLIAGSDDTTTLEFSLVDAGNYMIDYKVESGTISITKNNVEQTIDTTKKRAEIRDVKTNDMIKVTFTKSGNYGKINFSVKKILMLDGCINTGLDSQLPETSEWNSSDNSLAYVGYNYGEVYEISSSSTSRAGMFGDGVIWDGNNYTLTNPKSLFIQNVNYHYTCDDTDTSATTCVKARYYYSSNYYIVLQKGDTIETALKKMLSESSDVNPSPIKGIINTWYNTNIKNSYGKFVEDTKWCNDRSVSTANLGGWNPNGGKFDIRMYFDVAERMKNASSSNPQIFSCSNANDIMTVSNGKLDNPVALLTADEASLAGVQLESSRSYLISGSPYWLLSPFILSGDRHVYMFGVSGSNSKRLVSMTMTTVTEGGIRPVLSLKYGIQVFSGDGSTSNPYIVGTPIN